MPSTGVMAMTTTATDCVWSFPGAAGAPEVALVGSEVLPEADTDLHPDAQSTGSLCQVSILGEEKEPCLVALFNAYKEIAYFQVKRLFFFFFFLNKR